MFNRIDTKSLKVGDTAYIENSTYGSRVEVRTGVVAKVSPTGQVTVDVKKFDGSTYQRRFYTDGKEMTGDTRSWRKASLITKERFDELNEHQTKQDARRGVQNEINEFGKMSVNTDKEELLAKLDALRSRIDSTL